MLVKLLLIKTGAFSLGGHMKQLILEYNKIMCYRELLRKNMTDINRKIITGHFSYNGYRWLIVAKKRSKRVDLIYYDERRHAYFCHHSFKRFTKGTFLSAVKLLISDIVENTLEGYPCKAWYER